MVGVRGWEYSEEFVRCMGFRRSGYLWDIVFDEIEAEAISDLQQTKLLHKRQGITATCLPASPKRFEMHLTAKLMRVDFIVAIEAIDWERMWDHECRCSVCSIGTTTKSQENEAKERA